jgi:UDPglucose--hexose-1-phosphate uridylyltransferase
MEFNPTDHPHRRLNALTGEYVLVSPHRTKRPWQGKLDPPAPDDRPAYDPQCYLCPGNKRAGSDTNPKYDSTFVFVNDFSALLTDVPAAPNSGEELLQIESEAGECRVICFSPRHDLTLAQMSVPEIRQVIDLWGEQYTELAAKYRWVQIFENKGQLMGCSNPHPHGQIWAGSALPNEPFKEDLRQRDYFTRHGRKLLEDYEALESREAERIVVSNESWLAVVPFWAVWPFETLLLPRFPVATLAELTGDQRNALADVMRRMLIKFDNLFEMSFPYSMGWHQAPGLGNAAEKQAWQLHAHFYPPLLRSASVKKFLVGYELMAEAQRDLTPEQAAARLRDLPNEHYKTRR